MQASHDLLTPLPYHHHRQSADLSNQANQLRHVLHFPTVICRMKSQLARQRISTTFSHAPAPRPYPRANTHRHTAAPCSTSFPMPRCRYGRLSIYSSSSCRPWPDSCSEASANPQQPIRLFPNPLPGTGRFRFKKRPTGRYPYSQYCSLRVRLQHLRRKPAFLWEP